MNPEISQLVARIQALEEELAQRLDEAQKDVRYQLEGRRIRFSDEIKRLHRQYRTGALQYLGNARPLSVLTAPIIYGMVVPLAALDLTITFYQHTCFRAYGIPRVRRGDYIVIDRHRLDYLNVIEKLNCVYCGYGNGLIAYVREIVARTEQYWCPIRHARRVPGVHSRYARFFDYGDARSYKQQLDTVRRDYDD